MGVSHCVECWSSAASYRRCLLCDRNLLFLKDYDGDVSELGLDFTVANNDFGETQVPAILLLSCLVYQHSVRFVSHSMRLNA